MNWRQLPNCITVGRMVLVLPLVWSMREGDHRVALALAALAAASDALDGWLAKRFGWVTRLGGVLDPVADKLLLLACFTGLWSIEAIPTWLLMLVLGRDLVIVVGAVTYHVRIGELNAQPSRLGKLTTVVQIVFVLGLMLELAGGWLPQGSRGIATLIVALATLASGADYVQHWSRRALRESRRRSTR